MSTVAQKLFAFFIRSSTHEGTIAFDKLRAFGASLDDVATEIEPGKYVTRYGNIPFEFDVQARDAFDAYYQRAHSEELARVRQQAATKAAAIIAAQHQQIEEDAEQQAIADARAEAIAKAKARIRQQDEMRRRARVEKEAQHRAKVMARQQAAAQAQARAEERRADQARQEIWKSQHIIDDGIAFHVSVDRLERFIFNWFAD